MQNLILFFLLWTSSSVISQNESYCLIRNEIDPLLDSNDYIGAKKLWLRLENDYRVDPGDEFQFITESLRHDDIEFYKLRISSLIENHGYHYFSSDTLPENLFGHSDLVFKHNLHKWLIKVSNELYPNWIKNNPESYLLQQQFQQLAHDDQLFRNSIRFDLVNDTNCTGRELSWEILAKRDYQNAAQLATLCNRNGGLPNYFDNGFGTSLAIGLIVWHNLKTQENIHHTWSILSRHIDKAYFEGKIDCGLYESYDHWLLFFTGFQYYGFEGDAPVESEDEFQKRKAKYTFCY